MKKEVNCTNTRMFLDYIKAFHSEDYEDLLKNLDPEIDALPDPVAFLRDPSSWISCTVASKIYGRARSILNSDLAAYEIAKHAVMNTSLGYVQKIIIKAFWSFKSALKHAQKINDKWNRTKKVELVEVRKNQAIVRLHWDPHMDMTKDFCLINQAAYTFLPCIWGRKPFLAKETSCFFEGGPYCEYHLKWSNRSWFQMIYSRVFTSKSVLLETITEMEKDKRIIEEKYEEVKQLNSILNRKIEQLFAIQETGKAILSVLDLEDLLNVIINILSKACHINQAVIMLVQEDTNQLEYLYSTGLKNKITDEVKSYTVSLKKVSNILARVANTGLTEYIPEVEKSNLNKKDILLTIGRPKSLYIVPMITRSKVIGVIATDASDDDAINMLDIFAPQVAIAIENARLYQKLAEQMKELKRSHILLSRSEKLSFLGNIAAGLAHEIKNPLTSIGTFIQMLPKKFDDDEFRNEFYQIAVEEMDRINNLITELLDLAKVKESYFIKSDLHALIEKMILLISPQMRNKKIAVKKAFDPNLSEIWMDPEKMKQVILNLLYNAVEFTPKGGQIEIVTKNGHNIGIEKGVIIEIRDNGIGIPSDVINKIFDPYFTTKNKSAMHKGTGLGLFIANQNMQDHGGSIDVKSEVNSGTRFILKIPNRVLDSSG